MAKLKRNSLTKEIIFLVLSGFTAAFILFLILFQVGTTLLSEYFAGSNFIYNSETSYINELTEFVHKKKLAATDTDQLGDWAHQKGIRHFTISRERVLIYDSTYSNSIVLGNTSESDTLHYNWQYFHTVSFSDGDADVYIYANYELKYYLLYYIADAFISIFLWILLFAIGIGKKVNYIQQLSSGVTQIESGALDCEIPIKGNDELAILAHGLNEMRLSLIEKQLKEAQMKSAQDQLVLSMAHDLRTPLTGLMTFLEIARKQNSLNECTDYISKAYAKTTQIRDLSNQLFDFFLINSENPMKLEEPENVEYALGEYLSELCGLLEMDGYHVSIEKLHWEPVQIQICTDFAGRIIDNLVSNIKKYAHPDLPVFLISEYTKTSACITIQNTIAVPEQFVHGTGIGVKNIHAMMHQMHGLCQVNIESDTYSITLKFPVI